MAMIPGMTGQLPAVYGPITYPVKKIGDEYYIKGYSNFEFKGSFRDIAKQILLQLINNPEPIPRKNYAGPFHVDIKQPVYICCLCMDAKPDPPDLDIKAISRGISEEFRSLIKLLPFS